ncbi:MAG: signal peptidase I [Clostridia bacterium]|nr:signal peptidase I [Clostridia bacterium]
MKKLVKVWNVITTVLVVLVVLVAVLLVGVRVAGVQPLYVMSGSMEPAFHVGSLIFVQKVDPAKIEVGDPITYTINEAGDYSTHRVIAVEARETGTRFVEDANGQTVLDESGAPMIEEYPLEETAYYFQTKGDANNAPDGTPVYYKNVVGVPRVTIPYLGYLAHWLQTPRGRIMGITIAAVIVILTFLPDLLKWVEDGDKKKETTEQPAAPDAEKAKTGNE